MGTQDHTLEFEDQLSQLFYTAGGNDINLSKDIKDYTKSVKAHSYGGHFKDLKKTLMKVEANKAFDELMEDLMIKHLISKIKIQQTAENKPIAWSPRLLSLWELEKILVNHNSPKELMKIRAEAKTLEAAERSRHNEEMKKYLKKSDTFVKKLQVEELLKFWKVVNKKMNRIGEEC